MPLKNALLLMKKPVGWFLGGAKVQGGRAWAANQKPLLNLLDTSAGSFTAQAGWTDNLDGTATLVGTQASSDFFQVIAAGLNDGETYRVGFEVTAITSGRYQLFVGGFTSPVQTSVQFYEWTAPAGSTNERVAVRGLDIGAAITIRYDNAYCYHEP